MNSFNPETTHYRPDIDGLRAIAVVSVVVFHAFPTIAPGGFVGVDVFFVISGYLITGVLVSQLEQSRFSIIDFYVRRIRRIFPALVLLLFTVLFVGFFCLFPDEFSQLGKHTAASAGFLSNFMYWREAGYFDIEAEKKPLLHIWSLGVEEQFYVVWPLILWASWKHRWGESSVVMVLVLSFIASVVITSNNQSAAYFLPFTRFWELAVGSWLAIRKHKSRKPRVGLGPPAWIHPASRYRTVVGLFFLAVSFVLISPDSAFPGWIALVPVIGTALILSGTIDDYCCRSLLASRVIVWIGLISYPLYLWHWPILSFTRIVQGEPPNLATDLAAITLSVMLAWATYRYVERPFRYTLNSRVAVATLSAAMIFIGAVGYFVTLKGGFSGARLSWAPNVDRGPSRNLECEKYFGQSAKFNYCKASGGEPDILVIGDSHAHAIFDGLDAEFGKNFGILLAGQSGCPPLLGVDVFLANFPAERGICSAVLQNILEATSRTVFKAVFLVARGPFYIDGGPGQRYLMEGHDPSLSSLELYTSGLERMLKRIKAEKIYVILDNPTFPYTPRDCARAGIRCKPLKQENYLKTYDSYRKSIQNMARGFENIKILDPTSFFCRENGCTQAPEGENLYADTHHLTKEGGKRIVSHLVEQIDFRK
jgi:peptidoglycan/LPS O-acetylase OafA/YrhL